MHFNQNHRQNSKWFVDGSFSLSAMLTFSINAQWLVKECWVYKVLDKFWVGDTWGCKKHLEGPLFSF